MRPSARRSSAVSSPRPRVSEEVVNRPDDPNVVIAHAGARGRAGGPCAQVLNERHEAHALCIATRRPDLDDSDVRKRALLGKCELPLENLVPLALDADAPQRRADSDGGDERRYPRERFRHRRRAYAASRTVRVRALPNPLPTGSLCRLPENRNPVYAGVFVKPTPGFEPGTPSLRVKCSTS